MFPASFPSAHSPAPVAQPAQPVGSLFDPFGETIATTPQPARQQVSTFPPPPAGPANTWAMSGSEMLSATPSSTHAAAFPQASSASLTDVFTPPTPVQQQASQANKAANLQSQVGALYQQQQVAQAQLLQQMYLQQQQQQQQPGMQAFAGMVGFGSAQMPMIQQGGIQGGQMTPQQQMQAQMQAQMGGMQQMSGMQVQQAIFPGMQGMGMSQQMPVAQGGYPYQQQQQQQHFQQGFGMPQQVNMAAQGYGAVQSPPPQQLEPAKPDRTFPSVPCAYS